MLLNTVQACFEIQDNLIIYLLFNCSRTILVFLWRLCFRKTTKVQKLRNRKTQTSHWPQSFWSDHEYTLVLHDGSSLKMENSVFGLSGRMPSHSLCFRTLNSSTSSALWIKWKKLKEQSGTLDFLDLRQETQIMNCQ